MGGILLLVGAFHLDIRIIHLITLGITLHFTDLFTPHIIMDITAIMIFTVRITDIMIRILHIIHIMEAILKLQIFIRENAGLFPETPIMSDVELVQLRSPVDEALFQPAQEELPRLL